jgi:hypothetical protein
MSNRDEGGTGPEDREAQVREREDRIQARQARMKAREERLAGWEDGSIEEDVTADSRNMLLAFAGLRERFGMPVFEFKRITDQFRSNRLLLRDPTSSWLGRRRGNRAPPIANRFGD